MPPKGETFYGTNRANNPLRSRGWVAGESSKQEFTHQKKKKKGGIGGNEKRGKKKKKGKKEKEDVGDTAHRENRPKMKKKLNLKKKSIAICQITKQKGKERPKTQGQVSINYIKIITKPQY